MLVLVFAFLFFSSFLAIDRCVAEFAPVVTVHELASHGIVYQPREHKRTHGCALALGAMLRPQLLDTYTAVNPAKAGWTIGHACTFLLFTPELSGGPPAFSRVLVFKVPRCIPAQQDSGSYPCVSQLKTLGQARQGQAQRRHTRLVKVVKTLKKSCIIQCTSIASKTSAVSLFSLYSIHLCLFSQASAPSARASDTPCKATTFILVSLVGR